MKTSKSAGALGRLGGRARAKRLSPERKTQIASFGGKSRAKSLQAARRIAENFRYADAMKGLAGKSRPVTRMKTFKGRLPGIYA